MGKSKEKNGACPKCGSSNLDRFGSEPGDHPWMLCRDCGWVIEMEDKNEQTN